MAGNAARRYEITSMPINRNFDILHIGNKFKNKKLLEKLEIAVAAN